MYIITMFEMQIIYMYHMEDLISENLVSKLQERICGVPSQRSFKSTTIE